jgi:2-polyprenyl-3-methyl-5-hydroxy-6-metoxy-1,4-benzoquinol methylase
VNQIQINALLRSVQEYADRNNGKIYAPIDHPQFASFRSHHGPERFEPIQKNIPSGARTALDIGTHWGYFAHRLEQSGLQVTAVESLKSYLPYLYSIRTLYGDKFEIVDGSFFSMERPLDYDVVLALNIFHHFIKTEALHSELQAALARLKCKILFFQSHSVREGQMENSHKNYTPADFCEFIVEHCPSLSHFEKIGDFKSRPMFKIT